MKRKSGRLSLGCDFTVAAGHDLTVESQGTLKVTAENTLNNQSTVHNDGAVLCAGKIITCGGIWIVRGRKFGWRILVGGLFFVASDGILALHAFNGIDFPLRHAVVMGTYLIAEWLLVSGMVRNRLQSGEAE